jgi:hypothetical protein
MRILLAVLRLLATVQIALGLAFWLGYAITWIPVHMAVGVAFVLALWTIGFVGAYQTRTASLAVGAVGWGILIAAIGATQQRVLIGDLHWIVRVAHLIVSVAGLPLGALIVARAQKHQTARAANATT